MNIPVQKNLPSNTQGRPGDMVLVINPSGMYLYVKGNNTWGSLRLSTRGISMQQNRDKRRIFQESVRQLIEHDGTATGIDGAADHGSGTIAGGGAGVGVKGGSAGEDAPS